MYTCILGQRYNTYTIIKADIGNTIHAKLTASRLKVKQIYLLHNH